MIDRCHSCHEPITRHESWTEIGGEGDSGRIYHDDCWCRDIRAHGERGDPLPEDQTLEEREAAD